MIVVRAKSTNRLLEHPALRAPAGNRIIPLEKGCWRQAAVFNALVADHNRIQGNIQFANNIELRLESRK
jgi:hypothetical protein